MKKVFRTLLGGAFLLALPLFVTSCEDVLGHWEKPTPVNVVPETVVEEAKVLGAALETGAKVTVTYTIGTKQYKATFTKTGDTYTLDSVEDITPAPARAMTRGSAPTYTPSLEVSADGTQLVLKVVKDGTEPAVVYLEAYMDVKTGETCVLQFADGSFDVSGFKINDEQPAITNPYNKQVKITSPSVSITVYINYKEGETWKDVYDRFAGLNRQQFDIDEEGYIYLSLETKYYLVKKLPPTARAFTRWAYTQDDFVKSTDTVGTQDTYYFTTQAPNAD